MAFLSRETSNLELRIFLARVGFNLTQLYSKLLLHVYVTTWCYSVALNAVALSTSPPSCDGFFLLTKMSFGSKPGSKIVSFLLLWCYELSWWVPRISRIVVFYIVFFCHVSILGEFLWNFAPFLTYNNSLTVGYISFFFFFFLKQRKYFSDRAMEHCIPTFWNYKKNIISCVLLFVCIECIIFVNL